MRYELPTRAATLMARRLFGDRFYCVAVRGSRRVLVRDGATTTRLGEGRTWDEAFAATKRIVGLAAP